MASFTFGAEYTVLSKTIAIGLRMLRVVILAQIAVASGFIFILISIFPISLVPTEALSTMSPSNSD